MARQPINVHVYLYRYKEGNGYEFAIFQRSDDSKCWQGVSGGVEDGESNEQAALRECFEEAGTPIKSTLYQLDTFSYLPSDIFKAHLEWGKDVVVIPMYFYAMPFDGEIVISHEHITYKWCNYEQAEKLVYWHDQKTALWELKERLIRENLIR